MKISRRDARKKIKDKRKKIKDKREKIKYKKMEKNENRVIGVCEVWYALAEDVTGVWDATDFGVTVALNEGADWEQIPIIAGTATITEKAVRRDAGRCYEQEFSAEVAGEDDVVPEWLDEIDNRPAIVKIVQTNGTKIYGNITSPVRLMCDWNTERSSVVVGFSRDTTERARWLIEGSGSGE